MKNKPLPIVLLLVIILLSSLSAKGLESFVFGFTPCNIAISQEKPDVNLGLLFGPGIQFGEANFKLMINPATRSPAMLFGMKFYQDLFLGEGVWPMLEFGFKDMNNKDEGSLMAGLGLWKRFSLPKKTMVQLEALISYTQFAGLRELNEIGRVALEFTVGMGYRHKRKWRSW